MATKKCPNGHQYDSSIYGDKCPFCPESNHTHVNASEKTNVLREPTPEMSTAAIPFTGGGHTGGTRPTEPMQNNVGGGGHTVIRSVGGTSAPNPDGGKKVVALLVSYTANPAGEVFKIYEGKNFIGRDYASDVCFNTDSMMSGTHLLILYREAEGVFWAIDQDSSNGTYINGKFVSERTKLQTNDVIVVGSTKMVFLAIPAF